MIGVIVLTLGLPQMFESIDHGEHLDNGVMVAGYVIMRVALLFAVVAGRAAGPGPGGHRAHVPARGRGRPARVDPRRRAEPHGRRGGAAFVVLIGIELLGPFMAERKAGTPCIRTTSPSATACC